MANEIKSKLKDCVETVKNIENIETKPINEIISALKEQFSKSLGITEEKWKQLNSHKKLDFDIENMSMREDSLQTTLEKIAKNIKKQKEPQTKERDKNKKFNLVLTLNNALKNRIAAMETNEGINALKDEIIHQASAQDIDIEALKKPCTSITNKTSNKQLNLPTSTEFLEVITYVTYADIVGKDAFDKTSQIKDNDKKPKYQNKPSAQELVDDLLGLNDTKINKHDNTATYQAPQPGM